MSIIKIPWSLQDLNEEGDFFGYASVFGVIDHHGDVIEKGAFKDCLESGSAAKMLWQHDPSQVIGVWQHIQEDGYGLKVKGKLLKDIPKGLEAYTLLKNGAIDSLSVGFQVKKAFRDPVYKVRRIQEVNLVEISLVTFGANPKARVLCAKALEQRLLRLASRLEEVR